MIITKIFVPQPIPPAAAQRLTDFGEVTIFPHVDRAITREEVLDAVEDKDILYGLGGIQYDEEVMARAPKLRLIAAMHVSPYFVDLAAATRRRVPVSGITDSGLLRTTAEFTFALLIGTAWRLPEFDRFLRDGRWEQNQSEALLGTRLYGKKVGIVGLGRVGTYLAAMLRGFGMDVVYTKRSPLSAEEEAAIGAEFRRLGDLFAESDFVVVTLPLTQETQRLISADLLALLKPSAVVINTSRGKVIDEMALEEALASGAIRGAGLDVFEDETKPDPGPSARMRSFDNVVLTPHVGSAARETREEMALRTVENIANFLETGRPLDLLNPEVYGEDPRANERIG